MKLPTFAGLALACLSLGACSTLTPLTGNPVADAKTAAANVSVALPDTAAMNAFFTGINTGIETLAQHCNGSVGISWVPPQPPTPTMNVTCPLGQVIPLSQLQAVMNGTATISSTGKSGASGSLTVGTVPAAAPK